MNLLRSEWTDAEVRQKARLYEMLRKLSPQQFASVCRANISGAGSFDEIVHCIATAYETDESSSVGCAVLSGVDKP